MATLELTTATDLQKKSIRDTLLAIGVTGSNFLNLNGQLIAAGTVTLLGNTEALRIPYGSIVLGAGLAYGQGDINDGALIYNYSYGIDNNELRLETFDNGSEPIVLRQNDSQTSIVYEPLVVGSNHNVGIGSIPLGTRSFDNSLTVYGNISATGSIFVNSVIENSSSPLVLDVDTSSAALRVTQRGSGNVIEIEDSANPDSSPFVVNNTGQLVMGTLSAFHTRASLVISSTGIDVEGGNANIALRRVSNINTGSEILFFTSRGEDFTNYLPLNDNDVIGGLRFQGFVPGYNGIIAHVDNRGVNAGTIRMAVDGVPTLSSIPSRLTFSTTVSGATASTEKMRIDNAGNVGIGTTAPNERLTVVGNISASGTLFAQSINSIGIAGGNVVTSPSTVTGGISGITDIRVLSQSAYNSLSPKLSSTMYIIL
jgi:hypothetical protein